MKFEHLSIPKVSFLIEKTLKVAILDGKLKPGDKLPPEKEIAEQFGVSVVSLREALRALEVIGLINRKGKRGRALIGVIDDAAVKTSLQHYLNTRNLSSTHLYDVRKIVEPPAVRLAASQIIPAEIKALEENVSYCEEKLRDTTPVIDEKAFLDVDMKHTDFHRIIAKASRNPILSLTVDYVLDFLWEYETSMLVPDFNYSMDILKDHSNILELLKQGDGEKCEKEMIFHIEKLQQYLTKVGKGRCELRNSVGGAEELGKGGLSL